MIEAPSARTREITELPRRLASAVSHRGPPRAGPAGRLPASAARPPRYGPGRRHGRGRDLRPSGPAWIVEPASKQDSLRVFRGTTPGRLPSGAAPACGPGATWPGWVL